MYQQTKKMKDGTIGYYDKKGNIVSDARFLNSNGNIDWENNAPYNGFVHNESGPITKKIKLTKYDIVDRYGTIFGCYVCPIIDNIPFSYEKRSLPYHEETVKYMVFNICDNIDPKNTPKNIRNALSIKYNIQIDDNILECEEGEVASAFDQVGGAIQVKLKLMVSDYISLGWMKIGNKNEKK